MDLALLTNGQRTSVEKILGYRKQNPDATIKEACAMTGAHYHQFSAAQKRIKALNEAKPKTVLRKKPGRKPNTQVAMQSFVVPEVRPPTQVGLIFGSAQDVVAAYRELNR